MARSTAFLATVYTFDLPLKYPLAAFMIFFLLALDATEFTERGMLY